ncbi:MAG TPA: hypothetical protein VEY06_12835 [Flavisolibacter sp.]|nr:hypothetical protein [Flavisolibacter sp.]
MDRIERLKEFLTATPNDCFVKHALALEYVKLGDEAAAEQQFKEVLIINDNYIGSYYHLAKLLERKGAEAEAIRIYETGMKKAKAAGDNRSYSELQSAYEDLTY